MALAKMKKIFQCVVIAMEDHEIHGAPADNALA
jgi:hypothetical protein